MGIRIIEGNGQGDSGSYAALYCSISMVAFGPVFNSIEEATHFLGWFDDHGDADDIRQLDANQLDDEVNRYRQTTPKPCGEASHECRGPVGESEFGTLCQRHARWYVDAGLPQSDAPFPERGDIGGVFGHVLRSR